LRCGLLFNMQQELTIHDFVREAGSVRELAGFLGVDDRKGLLRVAQWASRGVIPPRAQLDFAAEWQVLRNRINRKQVAA